jgi:hypothetical protein
LTTELAKARFFDVFDWLFFCKKYTAVV